MENVVKFYSLHDLELVLWNMIGQLICEIDKREGLKCYHEIIYSGGKELGAIITVEKKIENPVLEGEVDLFKYEIPFTDVDNVEFPEDNFIANLETMKKLRTTFC